MRKSSNIKATPIPINWHPGLSIYASEPFLKTVGDDYGWLGGTDESGELRCVLPYTVVRKAMLRMVRFRIETIPIAGGVNLEEEKTFLNSVVDHFRAAQVDMIIPASTNAIFRTFPDGAVASPYGSYLVDLRKDEGLLLSQMSATHRKKIRQAINNGVEIKSGIQYMDPGYEIIKAGLKRSSMWFMKYGAFKHLLHGLGDNVKLFVAEHRGVLQGCTVFPFSSNCAYSLYGGSCADMVPGAMNLLNWEAMKEFRKLGVESFDFVGVRIDPAPGSKQEGIRTFKQRFGGELKEGYLWKYSLRRFNYMIYSLGAKILRGGDIVDQEKHKLKRKTSIEVLDKCGADIDDLEVSRKQDS